MMASFAKLAETAAPVDEAQVKAIDAHYDHSVRNDLYG